jgi:hypothetical protein
MTYILKLLRHVIDDLFGYFTIKGPVSEGYVFIFSKKNGNTTVCVIRKIISNTIMDNSFSKLKYAL